MDRFLSTFSIIIFALTITGLAHADLVVQGASGSKISGSVVLNNAPVDPAEFDVLLVGNPQETHFTTNKTLSSTATYGNVQTAVKTGTAKTVKLWMSTASSGETMTFYIYDSGDILRATSDTCTSWSGGAYATATFSGVNQITIDNTSNYRIAVRSSGGVTTKHGGGTVDYNVWGTYPAAPDPFDLEGTTSGILEIFIKGDT